MAQASFTGQLKISLPPRDVNTIPTLSQQEVNKCPQQLLDLLFREFKLEDYGDIKILTVYKEEHHEVIITSVQWITKGPAASFLNTGGFEVRKRQGDARSIPYDPQNHANDSSYQLSQKTRMHFLRELELYIFTILAGITDLRDHLSKKFRSYPVYSSEIVLLLEKLYSPGLPHASGVDQPLTRFVEGRIRCLQEPLAKETNLARFLRTNLPPKAEREVLLRHAQSDDAVLSEILPLIKKSMGETTLNAALLQTFIDTRLAATDPPLTAPTAPMAVPRAPSIPTRPASTLLDEIYNNANLVVAKQHGAVPLRNPPPNTDPRHRGFRFSRGEPLVVVLDNGREIEVRNRHGQVGVFTNKSLFIPLAFALDEYGKALGSEGRGLGHGPPSPLSEGERRGMGRARGDSYRPPA